MRKPKIVAQDILHTPVVTKLSQEVRDQLRSFEKYESILDPGADKVLLELLKMPEFQHFETDHKKECFGLAVGLLNAKEQAKKKPKKNRRFLIVYIRCMFCKSSRAEHYALHDAGEFYGNAECLADLREFDFKNASHSERNIKACHKCKSFIDQMSEEEAKDALTQVHLKNIGLQAI